MTPQFRHAIDAATQRIMETGAGQADLKDIMLAGFGYLAKRLRPPEHRPLLNGKRPIVIGLGAGVGAAEVVHQVWRVF